MSRYGIDYYGLSYYGPPISYAYSNLNFIAKSVKLGQINLTWDSPSGNWSRLKLTRNSLGFPVDPWDGDELDLKNDGNYFAFKENSFNYFNDTTVSVNGGFYYYSLFIYIPSTSTWTRVGNAIGLSAADYNYSNLLYEYTPSVYKVTSLSDPISNNYNEDLYKFLSLFGFQLNLTHTYTNLLVNRYDIQKVSGALLPSIMQEIGLKHEPEVGYQQERILVQNAYRIYKERGSIEGLREYIKAYSGYGITEAGLEPNPPVNGLTVSKNIMLDYNDSSAEESVGHWSSANSSASIYCLKNYNVTKVKLLSNVATLTLDAHNYQVGNKVYISGCELGLFNATASSVTITARTSTTISFSLTGTDVAEVSAFNNVTDSYPIIYPDPKCWDEPTAPTEFPNKQKGILAVKNANSGSGTVVLSCGEDSPVLKGIPVTDGSVYSFSIYAVSGGTARTITPSIKWYDRFGVLISTSAGSGTSDSTGQFSVRLKVENKTAPTGAYYAVPVLSIASSAGAASNEWHYFDCAQFELSASATDFEEARQLKIILKANRINELVNPHFHGMMMTPDPWTISGGTLSSMTGDVAPGTIVYSAAYLTISSGIALLESIYTTDFKTNDVVVVENVPGIVDGSYTVIDRGEAGSGNLSYITFDTGLGGNLSRTAVNTGTFYLSGDTAMVNPSGTSAVLKSWDGSTASQQMPIYYPNELYTFSVYSQGSLNSETITLSISWYDSTNTLISTSTGDSFLVQSLSTGNNWDRPYVTAVSPANAAYATVSIAMDNTFNGSMFHFDAALFEQKPFVLPMFDGYAGNGDAADFMWEGSSNASRSHYYKNFAVLSNSMATTALTQEIPLGTTFALYYAQPNT